jgi:inhibitor of cysteine peptidase
MKVRKLSSWSGITAAVLLIVVLSTSGCTGGGGTLEIDKNADGSTVALTIGQELVLSLESNPTTGYSWQLAAAGTPVLSQQGEVEFIDQGEEGLVGAGGVEVFRFTAEQAGTTELNLVYLRTWEEGISPIDEFSVTVEVGE